VAKKLISAQFNPEFADDIVGAALNPATTDAQLAALLDSAITWGGLGGGIAELLDGPTAEAGAAFVRKLILRAREG